MNLEHIPVYCHTDSTVVLAWLSKLPSAWPTFISNRVAHIHKYVPQAKWRHVPTGDNPADCSSRGLVPTQTLNHQLWWQGPSWLSSHSSSWPDSHPSQPTEAELELKRSSKAQLVHHIMKEETIQSDLADRFESWPKLIRVTAHCLRFIKFLRKKIGKVIDYEKSSLGQFLSTVEVAEARKWWILLVQNTAFAPEINHLKSGKSISKGSPLKNLNPFLDASGILRLGGRLHQAPIGYDEKHPVILPANHQIPVLITRHAHLRSLHGGIQLNLYTLRQGFWITGGRNLVKGLIRHCVICVRQRATVVQQLMGSLPDFRTITCRPFTHSGVDYAGPFQIRFAPGRGQRSYKGYVVLFICCVTRAIHLELVSDYTSQGFLAAYKRFISHRGMPAHLYSDNGTTFQGAD